MTTATINPAEVTFDLADVARTYRGATGCACGCGGDYFDVYDSANDAENNKRIKYVLRGIKEGRAEFFGNGVEVANPAYTRVTRLYFVEGVWYDQNKWLNGGRLVRTTKAGA